MVLKRLSRESDAVLMDLRGFLPDNQGCVFEINELLNVVPLDRVVFVVDATTDLAFLRETFAQAGRPWRQSRPTAIWRSRACCCSNLPARGACPD